MTKVQTLAEWVLRRQVQEFKDEHFQDFVNNIMNPTVQGLKTEGLSFKGFIFFRLMVTEKGAYLF